MVSSRLTIRSAAPRAILCPPNSFGCSTICRTERSGRAYEYQVTQGSGPCGNHPSGVAGVYRQSGYSSPDTCALLLIPHFFNRRRENSQEGLVAFRGLREEFHDAKAGLNEESTKQLPRRQSTAGTIRHAGPRRWVVDSALPAPVAFLAVGGMGGYATPTEVAVFVVVRVSE
jgi:hypothetical protein